MNKVSSVLSHGRVEQKNPVYVRPNCVECAKWAKVQKDNQEWIEGVKRGKEICEILAKKIILSKEIK